MPDATPATVPSRLRMVMARVLTGLACVVLLVAVVAGYVTRAAVDTDQFANRATAALRDDAVRTLVAEKITDDVVLRRNADLLAARPIIAAAVSGVVGGSAFTGLFGAGVRDVHRALFNADAHTLTLTVPDVGAVLGAAVARLRPSLAGKVEASGGGVLVSRDIGSLSARLTRLADRVRALAWLLLALAAGLAAGAVWASRDRRRAVVELGAGVAAAGVLLVVALGVLRGIATAQVEGAEARAAAGAVWDAFLGDLRTAAWILAGCGAVTAGAAASLLPPVDVRAPLLRLARRVGTEPRRPALRALRGAGIVAAGLMLLLQPDSVLRLVLTAVAIYVIYEGVAALLRLTYRQPAPDAARQPARAATAPLTRIRSAAPAVLAVAVIAGTITVFVGAGGVTTAAPAAGPCNGHRELCGRPLDKVALAATHNSMSVPLPGWYSAEQERPIAAQLNDGIRGLLIDTHYADKLANGRLRTDFGDSQALRDQAAHDGLSPEAVDAALRIRERLGFSGAGKRGMYLCHSFCELGGTPLGSVLRDIRNFLVSHPGEVLVVINQDYVTPKDFVGAVEDAGLGDLVYRGPVDGAWPTLRQMIDRDQRLVLLAENHAGAAPWYHLAYRSITQETPYAFSKVAQLTAPAQIPASCRPNRGPASAPMFLVNHWITTDPLPRPSDAAKVNAYRPLLARARGCERIRGRLPNLLAVNFYREGDLFKVVDTLNGVSR